MRGGAAGGAADAGTVHRARLQPRRVLRPPGADPAGVGLQRREAGGAVPAPALGERRDRARAERGAGARLRGRGRLLQRAQQDRRPAQLGQVRRTRGPDRRRRRAHPHHGEHVPLPGRQHHRRRHLPPRGARRAPGGVPGPPRRPRRPPAGLRAHQGRHDDLGQLRGLLRRAGRRADRRRARRCGRRVSRPAAGRRGAGGRPRRPRLARRARGRHRLLRGEPGRDHHHHPLRQRRHRGALLPPAVHGDLHRRPHARPRTGTPPPLHRRLPEGTAHGPRDGDPAAGDRPPDEHPAVPVPAAGRPGAAAGRRRLAGALRLGDRRGAQQLR